MRRREFIALICGAAGWPFSARAQQPTMPVIGFVSSRSADGSAQLVALFLQGLEQNGFVEGKNVTIEYRWAQGQYDRLPKLPANLVRRPVTLIFAAAPPSLAAAKASTATIPIVFVVGGDPVKEGFVASLNRPGGNATGVYALTVALEAKRLELLHECVPRTNEIAYLVNPESSETETMLSEVSAAARVIGVKLLVLKADNANDIDAAFAELSKQRIGVALIATDPFFNGRPEQFASLARRYSVPAMFALREFAAAGGLLSYGTSFGDAYRLAGIYAGRILKGEKPADLPVQESTKVDLVINLKTAKTLGLTFPITLLARADEVIE